MSNKMILDTDPGIDDAMAIFFAMAHPDIELLGLTTTFGNVSVEQATVNALKLVEMAGQTTPVAKGVQTPWMQALRPYPDFVHGEDGFGNLNLPEPALQAVEQSAAEFIVEQVKQNPGEVTLVAVGPLGNLAAALKLAPEIAQQVKQVIIMGGAVGCAGNVTPVAEANIICDPHAADIVFSAPWKVTMIGLDVTHQVHMDRALFDRIMDKNKRVGAFMKKAADFYMDFHLDVADIDGCHGHDVSAVACLVEPELFTSVQGQLCVATEGVALGQTIMAPKGHGYRAIDYGERPQVNVAMGVQDKALIALFEKHMSSDFWD